MNTYFNNTEYCDYWIKCKDGRGCKKALTWKIIEEADKVSLPIVRFSHEPKCYNPEEFAKK